MSETKGTETSSGSQLVKTYEYNNLNQVIKIIDENGNQIDYEYDNAGKVKKETKYLDPETSSGGQIETSSGGQIETSSGGQIGTSSGGQIETTYEYDLYDRLIKEIKANGSYTLINYNKDNTITESQKYASGNILLSKTSYTYNGIGKILTQTNYKDLVNNSGAIIQKLDYDNNGNVIKKIDPKGNETIFEYDEFNNLIQTTDSLGNKVINEYDKNNNLVKKIITPIPNPFPLDEKGEIEITYIYDKDNRLLSETKSTETSSGSQLVKTYEYNNLNQVIKITDENGNQIDYEYNYAGKVKKETKYLDPETSSGGQIETSSGGQIETSSGGQIETNYSYDERGNLTTITDANGNDTDYIYNNLNQLTKEVYADQKEVNYTYDKLGNLVSKTDPNGNITTNTFNDLGELVEKNIFTGTGVIGITKEIYEYDELGRLKTANDSNSHKLEFEYDSLNRLITETQSGSLVNYSYDDNGNLTSITNPNGKITTYSYDELNRNTNISFENETIATYSYTGILNDKISYGNTKEITKTFDELLRLKTLDNDIKTYTYTFDNVGNITSDNFKNYTYDDVYRVRQVTETNSGTILESFLYDNVGNRVESENPPVLSDIPLDKGDFEKVEYTTNNLNQYTSLSGTTLSGSLVYDNNGNLVEGPHPDPLLRGEGVKMKYEYDYKNRLVRVSKNPPDPLYQGGEEEKGDVVEFGYDVLGRRYKKEISHSELVSESITYIYAGENVLSEYKTILNQILKKDYVNGLGIDNVISIKQEDITLTKEEKEELAFCQNTVLTASGKFIKYGWDEIISRCETLNNSGSERAENSYYLHKDHLGSVVGISDGSGNILSEYEYDVFGNFTLSGSDIGNSILFTGREYDKEIGLYYFRARYYSASLGRFISRDPIGQSDDVNLYAYVGNNSVMFVDSMGKAKCKTALGLLKDAAVDSAYLFIDSIGLHASLGGGSASVLASEIIDSSPLFIILNEFYPEFYYKYGTSNTNLSISTYMLGKFMYGDGSSEYYGNNHWISQKVKSTNLYKNKVNTISKSIKDYEVGVPDTIDLFDGDKGIGGIGEKMDFGTSFGTITGTISGVKNKNGTITTTLNIADTYTFFNEDRNGDPIDNPFNKMGRRYQDRGIGKSFSWELNIVETFNY